MAPSGDADGAFLTPRVVDQAAFDDLAATLRTLIDDAGSAATRLEVAVRDAERAADVPDTTTRQIQERLRLGARMMQALQSQLDDADEAGRQLDGAREAIADSANDLERQAERLATNLEDRARMTGGGVVHTEQLVRALAARMDALDARVAAAVESANQACGQAIESAQTVTTSADDARDVARQCHEARSELGGALLAGTARIDEMTGRGEMILEGIEERLVQAEAAAERVASAAQSIDDASGRVDRVVALCGRLEALLERLAPWERLLTEDEVDADGLPHRAGQMVEALRTGIGEDMAQLSATMRELAERVDAVGLPGPATADTTKACALKFQA